MSDVSGTGGAAVAGTEGLVRVWREILDAPEKSWALFGNGTCVVLVEPGDDLARQAIEVLREYGPVHVGTPSGDFEVIGLGEGRGWVVVGHHPDVLTYVPPTEEPGGAARPSDLSVGLDGRSLRDLDGRELRVVHVEDNRPA
ncbi:hypothetical protein [Streptomyces avicenniae]|uniref:hypothetical protein n=1 Tax=Streptomyces avicenniae TaxID=500153 RepID=UPI00069BB5A0|nr:hypothetical protein [Streptomyces avicenniae]